jgi:hypothetical protein
VVLQVPEEVGVLPELPAEIREKAEWGEEMTTKDEEIRVLKRKLDSVKWDYDFEKRWKWRFVLYFACAAAMFGGLVGYIATDMYYTPIIEDYQEAVCDLKFGEGFEPVIVEKDPRNIECEAHPDEVDETGIHVRRGW